MTGDMPACLQRYFSLTEKRYDFKDIDEKAWGRREVDVKDTSGRSKKLDSRFEPGNDGKEKRGILWNRAYVTMATPGVSLFYRTNSPPNANRCFPVMVDFPDQENVAF